MTRQMMKFAATIGLFVVMSAAASAQPAKQMTVTMPFPFTVGKKVLPAGTYSVLRTSTTSGDQFLLRDAKGRGKVLFNTRRVQAGEYRRDARLEFRRYDERYFLARIWPGGEYVGRELYQGEAERDLARNLSKHQKGTQSEVVNISTQ